MIKNLIGSKEDILSGLTVALALVPEAVAFALVAGVDPLVGLYAAFIIGLIASIFGGRPGMISGATGALAVVLVELVLSHGTEYLFAAVILMGIIQVTVGLLKLGVFAKFIPHTVMVGFVNGLAIVILLAQMKQFKIVENGYEHWMVGAELWTMVALVALTMAITHFFPKLTKKIPAALVSILAVSLLVNYLGLDTRTVGDIASVGGGLPKFSVPKVAFSLETLGVILPYSIILAAVGLIESLMTLTLIDEITETEGDKNRECVGQGLANIVTGFFGGMGGCAMIGQSMININSGGRKRLSGIAAALFLLCFILFGSSYIEKIPLAALTGVMFMVVISTFEWTTFRIMKSVPKSDAFVIAVVSIVTVFTDLAVAVGIGIVVSSVVFAWKKGNRVHVKFIVNEDGVKEYHLGGALFFGSITTFMNNFDTVNDPEKVIIDFENSQVFDYSSIEAINKLNKKYKEAGKTLYLKNVSSKCQEVIKKASQLVEVNIIESAGYIGD